MVADELFVAGGPHAGFDIGDCFGGCGGRFNLLREIFSEKVEERQLSMNRVVKFKLLFAALALGLAFHSQSALACAACYGKSDSPLAQGMNWGIFSLLAVVGCVLGGIASFFIYLARKSAATPAIMPEGEMLASTQET
ncbi:MAG TPA: hypothetical protein VFC07_06670 [Verrucomicrobiae bacterium]|nr:hypothetical protein [Verrucomicrobiae bacterium]